MGTCDTCAKRGPWVRHDGRHGTYMLAECGNLPLPLFLGIVGARWVPKGGVSACTYYVPHQVEATGAVTQQDAEHSGIQPVDSKDK